MDGLAHPSISPQGHADLTTSQTTGRRPSPQPSWSLDSSQAPCLSFPASLSPLPGDQEGSPALPGQAEPRALHMAGQAPAQHLRMLTCTATPGPGVTEARPLPYVQEAARMGGPAAQAKGVCGLGKALGTGQPSGNPCPCPPFPSALEQAGGLEPFMLDRLVSEGPSRMGINAGSQAFSSHRTVCPGVRMRGALCLLGNRKARRKSSRQLVEGSNPHTKGPHFKSLPL